MYQKLQNTNCLKTVLIDSTGFFAIVTTSIITITLRG